MASNYPTILAPIQFNDPNSSVALEMARRLALDSKGRVFLLHVTPSKSVIPDLPGYREVYATDEPSVRRELQKLASENLADVASEIIVKVGDPAETINLVAQQIGAQMIVMCTHGRSGLSHFFMGSVAEKVVREAPCMVLTIRPKLLSANGA
ncbi:MAG TPA: universal stress protein [Candidatus Binataceae bacterium]|nr:universal stress protein [Candidatus Binataceae bacterium]